MGDIIPYLFNLRHFSLQQVPRDHLRVNTNRTHTPREMIYFLKNILIKKFLISRQGTNANFVNDSEQWCQTGRRRTQRKGAAR